MLIDGIDLLEGSIVENLTIDSGDATAQGNLSPSNGEMFYRTDLNEFQVYINGSWSAIGTQGDLANKVDVAGDTMTGELRLENASPRVRFDETDQGTDEGIWDVVLGGGRFLIRSRDDADSSGNIAVEIDRTGTTVDSVSFPNGNVGIGVSSPDVPLHIDGGSGLGNLTSGNGYLQIGPTNADNLRLDTNEIQSINNGVAADLFLQKNGGNVGIGILPSQHLHVHESSSNGVWMLFTNNTTGTTSSDGLLIGVAGSENARIQTRETTMDLELWTDDTRRFIISAANGGLYSENASGGSQGSNTINTQGFYIDGVEVNSGATVYRTSAQSISDSSSTTVSWHAEDYDDNSHWSSGNSTRLTSQTNGRVQLGAQVTIGGDATGYRSLSIRKNGTDIVAGSTIFPTSSTTTKFQIQTPPMNVSSSDYFELLVYQNSGGSLNVIQNLGNTFFWIKVDK